MRRLIALSAAVSLLVFSWVALAGDVAAPPPPQGPPGPSEWTDAGDFLYSTEPNDGVVIGRTGSVVGGSKFGIDGTADQVQLYVLGFSTQTSDIFRFQQDGGFQTLRGTNTGTLIVGDEASACVNPQEGGTSLCAISGEFFLRDTSGTSREIVYTAGGDYGDIVAAGGVLDIDAGVVGTTEIASGAVTGPKLGFVQSKEFSRVNPIDAHDNQLLWKVPYAITITRITCITDPADSGEGIGILFEQTNSTGDSPTEIVVVGADSDGETVTTFTDATVPANSYIQYDTGAPIGTVSLVHCTYDFTVD